MSQFIEMFGGESNKVPFEEIVVVKDDCRRPINEGVRSEMKDGELYPYYGATGVVDYINDYLTDDELLCIAEDCGNYNAGEESAYIIRGKAWVNNHAHLVKTKEACDVKYLYYFLKIADLKPYVSGTTRLKLTQKKLKKISVTLPSTDKQKTFVKIAEQADKSKFGDFKSQFIEMVGDPRNNPKGWPTKRLSELAEYSIGLTYKPEQICDDGTIVLRSGNIQDGKISFSDIVRVNAPIKESLFVKEDDILMCSRNGSASLVGKVAMIPDINEPMTFGAFMTIIRSAEAKYLYLYFQSQDFRERVSEGKSSTMNQITQKMLDKVEVPFPDKDVRETLSAIASQADKSKSVIQKALVYLNDIQSDELGKIA